jgi:FixJ family two-component response regulator
MTESSTVFVVDDDAGALESLQWMLEQADFHVKAFHSGREFLDSYRPEETGCLVLDVRMPEMDGRRCNRPSAIARSACQSFS